MSARSRSSRRSSISSTSSVIKKLNKLQFEKSPYLLQHKTNPVQWYPWGEEAFALAKKKNLPIFLSVGYSTCHWCHVMERESFENPEVAKVMNKYFVNVKVDREERPDIDQIYMAFVHAVSGSGGWPMSVWMTPDLKPFHGGTYYPPIDSYGQPGFRSLLLTISDEWKEKSGEVRSADKYVDALRRSATFPAEFRHLDQLPTASELSKRCLQHLRRSYEPAFGGFSEHPKFPVPVNILFLLHHKKAYPTDSEALPMVERTLREMAKGGIHDHIGKGFSRYSVDKRWRVPHFEKMLYDNAQLAMAYTNAYLLTKDNLFSGVVTDILAYVSRDLTHNEGGFYSAEDADSLPTHGARHKLEGAFYVWTKAEIDNVLEMGSHVSMLKSNRKSDIFAWRYGVRDAGNVDPRQDPHGELRNKNVLYTAHSVEETAKHFGVTKEEVRELCIVAKEALFQYRQKTRPRPELDSKFIASWNGLMISAFVRAGSALHLSVYVEAAQKAMKFVNKYLKAPSGDLYRACYRNGNHNSSPVLQLEKPILGCVDDFANLVTANLDLFDATGTPAYLQEAIKLQAKQDDIFWDSSNGGYFASRQNPRVIVRFKDDDDGVEPSSNSVSVINLIRLHTLTANKTYKGKAEKLFLQFGDHLAKNPKSLPYMVSAWNAYNSGTITLMAVLRRKSDPSDILRDIRSRLLPPGSTVVPINADSAEDINLLKVLIPDLPSKLERQLSGETKEVVFLKQGSDFAYTYTEKEFPNMLRIL